MKVLITGGSGMIGSLVLGKCLESPNITEVISFVRKKSEISHSKLVEIVVTDFEDYSLQEKYFNNAGLAFFCLGVYTGQVSDDILKKVTVDYSVAFAKMLSKINPGSRICLLSGAGADRSEQSRTSFARYKGMAENQISRLNLSLFSFRPAYIYPTEPRNEPNILYKLMRLFYPIIKWLGRNYSIKSTELAAAMFNVGMHGAEQSIIENQDILKYS